MTLIRCSLWILLIALMFNLTSCGAMVKSMAKKKYTVENNAIPPEFGKGETMMICELTGRKGYDKKLKKIVSDEYNGKTVFVSKKGLELPKYEDTSIYRYVFVSNQNWEEGQGGAGISTSAYYIIDRKENIKYQSKASSSFYKKLIQGYMINLEEVRLKNQ